MQAPTVTQTSDSNDDYPSVRDRVTLYEKFSHQSAPKQQAENYVHHNAPVRRTQSESGSAHEGRSRRDVHLQVWRSRPGRPPP